MTWMVWIRQALGRPASRWLRFGRDLAADAFLIAICLVATEALVGASGSQPLQLASYYFAPVTALTVFLLFVRGVYFMNARYMGLYDFLNMSVAGALGGLGFGLMAALTPLPTVGPNLWVGPILFTCLLVSALAGSRIALRIHDWSSQPGDARAKRKPRRALIVGAGDAGELILRELKRSRHSESSPVALVDDLADRQGMSIHGVPVLGKTSDIPMLVKDLRVDDILLAIPSADGPAMRRIYEICEQTGARVRTLPPVSSILSGDANLTHHLREVEIEDLLRREPARADVRQSAEYISGETVLVTGGGGSIGSELARQIAQLSPANLVLLGKGENSIYEIEQELIQTLGVVPTCVIADVRDRQSMEAAFAAKRPSVVFHAAAHKHVPLMQANPGEAIKNNVFGTLLAAELAVKYGVRKFVYISTDKAVNPSSVMGATKRVGEMIVRALADRSETEFAIVRFGNVLGSRGSLIPMLKAQIKRGGPVRLTHPDMTRYFMTIPEAVQLIMRAGALGSNGELYILDMGEPIKIVDLARDLIRLHGLVPGEDIEMQFTGIRPGEKTHEELLYDQEELQPTAHSKIRQVKSEKPMSYESLFAELKRLREVCDEGNPEKMAQVLMEIAWGKSIAPFAVMEAAVEESDAVRDL